MGNYGLIWSRITGRRVLSEPTLYRSVIYDYPEYRFGGKNELWFNSAEEREAWAEQPDKHPKNRGLLNRETKFVRRYMRRNNDKITTEWQY